jgi:hypothetical protein
MKFTPVAVAGLLALATGASAREMLGKADGEGARRAPTGMRERQRKGRGLLIDPSRSCPSLPCGDPSPHPRTGALSPTHHIPSLLCPPHPHP